MAALHIKNMQISEKEISRCYTSPKRQCTPVQYHLFQVFTVFYVQCRH